MFFKKLSFLVLPFSIALQAVVPQWHWDSINVYDLELPDFSTGFRWGVALSEYQNSGASRFPDSNWAHWERQKLRTDGEPTIKTREDSGYACDFWQNYPEDITLITELGCNSLRISVEWAAIEPVEGQFNQEALDHYKDLIKQCNDAGIDVMVTLYHWTHPWWFEEKGAFENEENIKYFVRYCTKVFEELHNQVTLWCTINEIGSVIIQAYLRGVFPPGRKNPWLAMKVTRCMMLAHYKTYKALKKLPGGHEAQIGLVHAYVPMEPHDLGYDCPRALPEAPTTPLHPVDAGWSLLTGLPRLMWAQMNVIERGGSAYMNFFFNTQMLKFLRTGSMFDLIPGMCLDLSEDPDCVDFIGLNFYARVVLESNFYRGTKRALKRLVQRALGYEMDPALELAFPSCRKGEIMSDMQYPVCPESLYSAIQEFSTLGKPIYITENGAPDGKDDRREMWIRRYLYALSKAISDGYDVRGYYYWSLMDNFEWDEGYAKKFGLYEVNFKTQERTLRKGAYAYKEIVEKLATA
jgi:beta-glucosidase